MNSPTLLFDTKVGGRLPVIRSMVVTDNIARGKYFMSLRSKKMEQDILSDLDLFYLSASFQEKFQPLAPDGEYTWSIRNEDSSPVTINLVFELEY
ncbi:MAG: hypothetical protein AB2L13_21030 [Spirochaetota bacterium]